MMTVHRPVRDLARYRLADRYEQRFRPRLHDRHPGDHAYRPRPGTPRPRRRPQHGRLRLGLSRLAARRRRSGDVAHQGPAEGGPHRVPAGRQRGSCRHSGARKPAGRDRPEPHRRWRLRHVVRQGTGCRPRRRCTEARQCLRLIPARRRACGGRRRPRLRVVVHAAPVRRRLHGLVHAHPEPGERGRISRVRRIRLRAFALLRHVGRLQGRLGDGGISRLVRPEARPRFQGT